MAIFKDAEKQSVVWITSETPGPRAVVFGGVHGDEVSGIHAIEKIVFDFFGGNRRLLRGSLVIARANEQAMAAEKRYVKYNMNRMFRETYEPEIDRGSYEFQRVQELKTLLDGCDHFLDLHSAPIADAPFLVTEQDAVEFYRHLGLSKIMTGWQKFSTGVIGGDAENYARQRGALSATLESGSHFDKASNDIAYKAVISFLSRLGMIEAGETGPEPAEPEIFEMYSVVTKEAPDFHYVGDERNFRRLQKNETFASQNESPLKVDEESYLLIPMRPEKTAIHEEICYLGRKVETPARTV